MRWLALLPALWVCLNSMWAQPPAPTNQTPATLTEAKQVLKLAPAEANRLHPVQLRGVVTCFDKKAQLLFVQDATAGIFIWSNAQALDLKAGQMVEVTGTSAAGRFSPIVSLATIKVDGEGQMPPARRLSAGSLATGSLDAQWVEVRGIVRRVYEDWGPHRVIEIATGDSKVKARVLNYPVEQKTDLAGAQVRARGVVGTQYNQRGQVTGFHLYVSNLDHITVIESPSENPFSAPVQSGRSLMTYAFEER